LIAAALLGPLLLNGAALLVNLALHPGQLTLGRRRNQLAGPTQTVLIPHLLRPRPRRTHRDPGMLLQGLQHRWRAEKVIVIGYPAHRALQRLYRDLGRHQRRPTRPG
jgi:hypothetical protein